MTKHEMISEMSSELGITKKKCGETLNIMLEEIISTMENGGKFVQPGFGTFKPADSKERVGRNPATGQTMLYPEKRKVRFKASELLKDEINE